MISAIDTTSQINQLTGVKKTESRSVNATVENGAVTGSEVKKDGNITSGQQNMGKTEFLHLLITSLQHQDPLDPVKNEAFISQIAQFSALENSLNMTSSIDNLASKLEGLIDSQSSSNQQVASVSAASLLGKNARIHADVNLKGNHAEFQVHINDGESSSLVTITNDKDEIVAYLNKNREDGILDAGDQTIVWNGSTTDGKLAPPGTYTARITDMSGIRETGYVYAEDTVGGITYDKSGILLEIGGQILPFDKVIQISDGKKENG